MTDAAAKLVYMANQIALAFRTQGQDAAAGATFDHIVRFWDPRMRQRLAGHVAEGGAGLNAIALAAAGRLRATESPPQPKSEGGEAPR